MRISSIIIMLMLISFPASGQDHVERYGGNPSCQVLLQNALNANCDVTIWNARDTQSLIAVAQQDAKRAAQSNLDALDQRLKDQITLLQANIKALSDANDALTKRLNDLEAKLTSNKANAAKEARSPEIKAARSKPQT